MRFDLAALARNGRNRRRKAVVFRDIKPPATFASNLYAAVYAPAVAIWTRRTDAILAEYERSLSALTTDAASDINGELDQAEAEFLRLVLSLRAAMGEWSLRLERWQRGRWIGAALAASDVDLSTMLTVNDVQQPLEAAIEWNVSLVKDVSAQARQRIGTAIFDGLRNRTPAREVAAKVREATGMARDRSTRIASDQLSKLTAALNSERRTQAGLSVYMWRHSLKKHPRVRHEERDGNLYSSDPGMVGRVVEGKTVAQEVAADDRPGRPPFCGCREQAVLIFD